MSETLTPESFRDALYSHKHTLPQLRRKLESLRAVERAPVLFSVFADECRSFRDQETAGRLLVSLNPKPTLPLEEILRSVAATWNVSVEQLPFYLRDMFGRDEVAEVADRLSGEYPQDSREARAMSTVCWWIGARQQ
jgi:hypothetical protein